MSTYRRNKRKRLTDSTDKKMDIKPLFPSLKDNIKYICDVFNFTDDLKMKEIDFHGKQGKLIYLETMVDPKEIEEGFLIPLAKADESQNIKDIFKKVDLNISTNLNDAPPALLVGSCALVFEGDKQAFLFNAIQINVRAPDEPDNEKVVRGSHEGFIENIDTNLNLMRQRIKSRQLMIKYNQLGMESNTKVAIVYMNKLADPSLVKEIEKRLLSVSKDMVIAPGFIEERLEDSPYSPFPQIMYTERPDRLEAQLMEGRVAIMSNGSSDAIIMPVTFFSFFQTSDDYNFRFYTGSVFRLLRLLSFWGALIFPPLYIAVIGFHFEIIPYDMVTIVKSSTENVPFPPFFEALIMLITIELIREAGIRLPSPIGQTIGIVGGLIIGEAVVNAGLVSNMMVIVIALTAIMSFTIPSYEMGNTVRILSLPIMVAAATLGFVGIVMSLIIIVIHMCKLESFRTPYLSPLVPLHLKDLKDAFVRFPIWSINKGDNKLEKKQQQK